MTETLRELVMIPIGACRISAPPPLEWVVDCDLLFIAVVGAITVAAIAWKRRAQ